MTTDGGGWTLVSNYLHQGGTNPPTQVRTADLPLLGATALGAGEAASPTWGHAAVALLSQFTFSEVRFFCRSSAEHGRVIHFKTAHPGTVEYVRTGAGNSRGVEDPANHVLLNGHTGYLPAAADYWMESPGDTVLINHAPAWKGFNYHYNVNYDGRWECDDYNNGSSLDTHHQAWIR
jgi:hypothetical protein